MDWVSSTISHHSIAGTKFPNKVSQVMIVKIPKKIWPILFGVLGRVRDGMKREKEGRGRGRSRERRERGGEGGEIGRLPATEEIAAVFLRVNTRAEWTTKQESHPARDVEH
jgi:hypothetical protein